MKNDTEQRCEAFLKKTIGHIVVIRPDVPGYLFLGVSAFIAVLITDILFLKAINFSKKMGLESGIQSESMFVPFFLLGTVIVLWRLFSYRIELSEETLVLHQLLGKRTITWNEIRGFKDRVKLTHWESRTHPPSAIYILLKGKKGYETYINGKLFSRENLNHIKQGLNKST